MGSPEGWGAAASDTTSLALAGASAAGLSVGRSTFRKTLAASKTLRSAAVACIPRAWKSRFRL